MSLFWHTFRGLKVQPIMNYFYSRIFYSFKICKFENRHCSFNSLCVNEWMYVDISTDDTTYHTFWSNLHKKPTLWTKMLLLFKLRHWLVINSSLLGGGGDGMWDFSGSAVADLRLIGLLQLWVRVGIVFCLGVQLFSSEGQVVDEVQCQVVSM